MKNEFNNWTTQDYLKHIFNLTQIYETANTNSLAERMGIKAATVTEMLGRLSSTTPPLVHYKKYQGVTLTEEGRKAALRVIRRHRLIETYLVTELGYGWDTIHEEACRLEHVVSDEFEQRIAEALGNPRYSPHGEPIPAVDLSMPPAFKTTLAAAEPNARVEVLQVPDTDSALLRHLWDAGIFPGNLLTILARSEFDGNLTIQPDTTNVTITLGPAVTSKIFIHIMESS